MELDKLYVKEQILTLPGIREAMRENNYDEVFKLCGTTKKRMQLARALNSSGVNFLQHMTSIPESLFRGCDTLLSIKIPGNIKEIGDFAFMGSGLQAVTIEDGVEKIGKGAFAQTAVKEIHIPKSVKELKELSCGKARVWCFMTEDELLEASLGCRPTTGNVINEETGEVLIGG